MKKMDNITVGGILIKAGLASWLIISAGIGIALMYGVDVEAYGNQIMGLGVLHICIFTTGLLMAMWKG